uniref:Uncharacterized protein n=1 Tax=Anguilla anguilla TaxID=7936 RepID=A0A0E9X763_ANGAN
MLLSMSNACEVLTKRKLESSKKFKLSSTRQNRSQ